MKQVPLRSAALALVAAAACSPPSIRFEQKATAPALSPLCCPKILQRDDALPAGAVLLARIRFGETGVSIKCSREQNLERARQKACSSGADLLRLTHDRGIPMSTCHRVEAEMYRLPERPQLDGHDGAPVTDGTALCQDRFSLRPRDLQGSAPRAVAAP